MVDNTQLDTRNAEMHNVPPPQMYIGSDFENLARFLKSDQGVVFVTPPPNVKYTPLIENAF
jgi:hypothetical protein